MAIFEYRIAENLIVEVYIITPKYATSPFRVKTFCIENDESKRFAEIIEEKISCYGISQLIIILEPSLRQEMINN